MMTPEGAGRSEFPQFMAYHILGNEHRNMFASVMNRNGVSYEGR